MSNDDYSCPICFEVLEKTCICLKCKHFLCSDCYNNLKDRSINKDKVDMLCPKCRHIEIKYDRPPPETETETEILILIDHEIIYSTRIADDYLTAEQDNISKRILIFVYMLMTIALMGVVCSRNY
jgi:hypothetical protein